MYTVITVHPDVDEREYGIEDTYVVHNPQGEEIKYFIAKEDADRMARRCNKWLNR